VRGDLHELKTTPAGTGHEQHGKRYALIVQSDNLMLSTWLVAPTSTSTRPTDFRPEITVLGSATRVLVEQTAAVAPSRLGKLVGRATLREMQDVEAALRAVLDL